MGIKLSTYAARVGVTWKTANRWFHNGQIPGAWQTETGRIFVPDDIFDNEQRTEKTVIYARVSSYDQRGDLERQVEQLTQFCIANGHQIDVIEKEIGGSVNDKRKKLLRTLSDPDVTRIVVEHKDRLPRFGFNYIQALCDRDNIELVVVNKAHDDKTDLVEELESYLCEDRYCQRN